MNIKKFFGNIEQYIAVFFMVAMLIILTTNTVGRYLFHVTLPWAEEVSAYGQIWLVYIAVSYAVKEKAHICIDSVVDMYPKKFKEIILLLGFAAWLIFALIMTGVGIDYVIDFFHKNGRAISLPIPMWIIYLSIPVGHACLSIRIIQQMIMGVKSIIRGGNS